MTISSDVLERRFAGWVCGERALPDYGLHERWWTRKTTTVSAVARGGRVLLVAVARRGRPTAFLAGDGTADALAGILPHREGVLSRG